MKLRKIKTTARQLITLDRVCKSPVVKPKSKKRTLQKSLVSKMCYKKFRKPLKVALEPNVIYTIIKCTVEKTIYSKILLIDVIPATGGAKIETYFTNSVTKRMLECCAAEGGSAEELVPGISFIYRGEIKSEAGNMYPNVDFCVDEEEENHCH